MKKPRIYAGVTPADLKSRNPMPLVSPIRSAKVKIDTNKLESLRLAGETGADLSPGDPLCKWAYEQITRGRIPEQYRVLTWAVDSFGAIAKNRDERAARLVEEAMEVAQAENVPLEVIHRIADRIYSRPVGDLGQEIGGLGITILALCENSGIDFTEQTNREFERVLSKPRDWWQKKHAEKVAAGTADLSPTIGRRVTDLTPVGMVRSSHMCIDLRGVLRNFNHHEWRKSCTREDGTFLTSAEVRDHFLEQLAMGRRVVPFGKPCEGFSYQTGCPGHLVADKRIACSYPSGCGQREACETAGKCLALK